MMLLKLSMTDEVQTEKNYVAIWTHLKHLHETSNEGQAFFLKNMLVFDNDE